MRFDSVIGSGNFAVVTHDLADSGLWFLCSFRMPRLLQEYPSSSRKLSAHGSFTLLTRKYPT